MAEMRKARILANPATTWLKCYLPRESPRRRSPRTNDDVLAYNAAAKKIMKENGIKTDDLFEFALPRLKEIQIPANVHFTPKGSEALAQQVAAAIEQALRQ